MRRHEFNEAVYYEFIRSDIVLRAKVTYGTLNRMVGSDIQSLWNIANRITAEISRAVTAKSVRRIDSSEGSTPPRNLCLPTRDASISVDNCVKFWQIQANPPFKKIYHSRFGLQ
ncbi:unnamed protein product [Cylicocyclus nassatus]|uniref:Uncharacterized protein n=1 Tax=Cylicocyclus nassatus TaxID=53992 RepID=A0AA36GNU1_CYLNA|nr:unnamed protein product [Cylicocyclus nassatus]